jgi:hypothetical protein
LKHLGKLCLVSHTVQHDAAHAKNTFVLAVEHRQPKRPTIPDFGNTAKRQERALRSRGYLFIREQLTPHAERAARNEHRP